MCTAATQDLQSGHSEINDYLRLLYAKIGKTYSPISGKEVTCDTPKSVSDHIIAQGKGNTVLILADIRWREEGQVEKLLNLKQEGFIRMASSEGSVFRIEEILQNRSGFEDMELYLLVDHIITTMRRHLVAPLLSQTALCKESALHPLAWSNEVFKYI